MRFWPASTKDETVEIAQSEELVGTLQAKGVPVPFAKIDDGQTFEPAAAKRQLAFETLSFFTRYLGATP